MGEVTALLGAARAGDPGALEAVFDRVYPELRRLALGRARAVGGGETLNPTALVHEAFLRLIGSSHLELEDRRHFFACAARAMRLVLIDHLRRSSALKRFGREERVTWSEEVPELGAGITEEGLLDLDRALDELAEIDPRAREVVALRFFAGLTAEETAEVLQLSLRTVNRDWQRARAFLYSQLRP